MKKELLEPVIMKEELLETVELEQVVDQIITPSVFVQPAKVAKQAIADFSIEGFREVKAGEIITISLDVLRDFGLLDKVK